MLRIDGQQRHLVGTGCAGEDFARRHHAFLVCQADGLSGEDGGVGGLESGNAHDGGDDEIDLGQGGDADGSLGAVNDLYAGVLRRP